MKEKEEKQVVNLQSAQTQELRNFMREINGSCINSEQLTIVWVGWKKTIRNLTTSK